MSVANIFFYGGAAFGGCVGCVLGGVASLAIGWIGWENMFGCIGVCAGVGVFLGISLAHETGAITISQSQIDA